MSLEALAQLAEIIGGAAVLVTLIFLVVEVRRNTAATRSLTHQQLFDSVLQFNMGVAESSEIGDLIVKANSDPESVSSSERIRLQYLYVNIFTLWHSAFSNHRDGLLNAGGWKVWDQGCKAVLASQAGLRDTWHALGYIYESDFAAHVGKALTSVDTERAHDGVLGIQKIENAT